jgi:hypothetical protein
MWDKLSRADFENARQQLNLRREETLRRHAEELQALDNDHAEVEELERLIGTLFTKFHVLAGSHPASDEAVLLNGTDAEQTNSVAGVSFLITQSQKLQLRQLGIRDEEIRNMKPDEAHRLLGVAS